MASDLLSIEALFVRARGDTGLLDFGTSSFVPALGKLVESINSISDNLHDKGRRGIEDWLLRLLVNRLRMQRDITLHPEILSETLLPPAAIIGLPRTGSTKLQRMLAAGHAFHELLFWQAFNPAPFPHVPGIAEDPRIQSAAEFIGSMASDVPDSYKGHKMIVEQVEEESHLIEQCFETPTTISFVPAFGWCRYIERLDKTDMYLHLRKCLQYLQRQFHRVEHKPWLLKYPANLGNESYISRTFPGIRYVVTHRDPFPVLASLSRLIASTQLLNCREYDIKRISRWSLDEFSSQMERHLAWRDANPQVQVLDVSFDEIVRNGLDVARRVYAYLDIEWDADTETEIHGWLAENEQQTDKLEYRFDDLAFSEAECRERFADYYERFAGMF